MKKRFKKAASIILAGAMVLSMAACGNGQSANTTATKEQNTGGSEATADFTPVELRMANQHSSDTIANQLDQEICDRIAEETDGRIKITLYSDSSLGDYTKVFDELMLGSIEVAHISPVETYDSRVSATMLPYLAFSYDDLLKVYDTEGYLFGQLNEALSALGIKLTGVFCEGFNGIGSMQELTNANVAGQDKGIICRSPMMDVYALCLQDLGFRVSSMPYSDTYTAMQTGVVAGLAGATAQVNYLSFRDIIKAYYDYRYIQEATMIMFNQKVWDSFLPEDQATIQNIINETCEKAVTLAEETNNDYMDKLEAEGIAVYKFTDDELAAFSASCRENVWSQLAKNYPEGFLDAVKENLDN